MAKVMKPGRWAQVLGTFDLGTKRGAITSLQPTEIAMSSTEGGDEKVRLKGFDNDGKVLFDLAVNPMRNSCMPRDNAGTFEEFVPVTSELRQVRLFVDEVEVSDYQPGRPSKPVNIQLGAPALDKPSRIVITGQSTAAPNVSYTIQARPKGEKIWQTIGLGLPTVDTGEVDINQFPNADRIEVRILQSDGLREEEVFRGEKEF